jgi:succinyl-CoA synthetase beta subunit
VSVLVGRETRLLVQGMGKHGTFHAIGCRDYGTNVVGGVTPGKGGSVGCMVNGAGLAMATMDIIKLAGGSPANFLDVGGGASADQIKHAFRILLADHDVRAVLINIFGGILRCDILAEGVIAAVRDLSVEVPVVVRMKGNNEERGRQMLQESGLNFATADGMTEAAERVVAAVAGAAR